MYSRLVTSSLTLFYIVAVAFFALSKYWTCFAIFEPSNQSCIFLLDVQPASAAPAPIPVPTSPTVGEVVADNRNMACRGGSCYYKDVCIFSFIFELIPDIRSFPTQNGTTTGAAATTSTASEPNGALSLHDTRVMLPAVIAGTSLLFML